MPNNRTIDGQAVREIRLAMGLSAAEVAAATGISRASLCNVEAGRRHPRTVVVLAIARALGVHPDRITIAAETRRSA